MKKITNLLGILFLILFVQEYVWAGDSVTISVSCVIPAIPGINAPVSLTEEKIKENETKTAETKELSDKYQYIPENQSPGFIVQEETRQETRLDKDKDLTLNVKTIYSH